MVVSLAINHANVSGSGLPESVTEAATVPDVINTTSDVGSCGLVRVVIWCTKSDVNVFSTLRVAVVLWLSPVNVSCDVLV